LGDHVLTSEFKNGWLARHASLPTPVLEYGSFQISPGDPNNDFITGRKERATVGSKLSGIHGDPVYRGTTVLVIDS